MTRKELVTVFRDDKRIGQFVDQDAAEAWVKKHEGTFVIVPSHTIPKPDPAYDDAKKHVVSPLGEVDAVVVHVPDDVIGAAVRESLATDKTDDNERPEEEGVL